MVSFPKKTVCSMLFVTLIAMSTTRIVTLAAIQTSETVLNSGTISYALARALPLTGLGADYTLHYSNQDAEVWIRERKTDVLAYWKALGYHTSRIGFVFANCPIQPLGYHSKSVYEPAKMDRVVEILNSVGVKTILDLHNDYDMQRYIGSWDWVNSWKDMALHYKNNPMIAALQIFNEPFHTAGGYSTWATDGPLGAITSNLKLQQAFAYLVREIHKIDPNRLVIYPLGQLNYAEYNEWFADLQSVGILSEPNVVYDVIHPYFFENSWDKGMTPEQKAAWYADKYLAPSVNFFGANKIWCGETFAWTGPTSDDGIVSPHEPTYNLQVRWLTAIINEFVKYKVGFQVWCYPSLPSEKQAWNKAGMLASNYYR